ncbi:MAG: polyprenyl synthetase family protein [Lachnospiraceae bacterium]|nr:polyprenyl synthetase family protein [Lachnospiraceae bacterium]
MNFDVEGLYDDLESVESYMAAFLPASDEDMKMNEIISAVTEPKGKRFRPLLLLLAGRMGSGSEKAREVLCQLGACVELIHMASLVHDDIVDDSPLRRGKPTIQSRFGKDMAVYTGDFILGRVMQVLCRNELHMYGEIFGRTIEDMCRGEIGQFNSLFDPDITIEEYLHHIYGKTVSLFKTACRCGGIAGGAGEDRVDSLVSMGEHFGYMFQIRDDLMNIISTESKEGKPVSSDFSEGIFTMPVIYAMESPEYGGRVKELALRASEGALPEEDMALLISCVRDSGGIRKAEEQMKYHHDLALRDIESLPENSTSQAFREMLGMLSVTP